MGIGLSVMLMAVGAILIWAVEATMEAVNLDVVGIILMITGAVGLLWALLTINAADTRRVVED